MTVVRRGLREQVGQAEQKLGSRFCSYCTLMRDSSTFVLKKGKPPICGACDSFRKWRKGL